MTDLLAWLTGPQMVLPPPWALRWMGVAGWALVLASLAAALTSRLPMRYRAAVAGLIGLWACVAGAASPAYWLGLAFNVPSLTAVAASGYWLARNLSAAGRKGDAGALAGKPASGGIALALGAVALGYALLLDTFALLPVQLYALGFAPAAPALVLVVALLPWVAGGGRAAMAGLFAPWMWVLAVAVFTATRLPTGNVWDAVLDPITWVLLQCYLVRALFRARER